MEDKIKEIYKNKVIEKFTQVPIEFRDKYMIPNEMELEIMREIWKEAQKELLENYYKMIGFHIGVPKKDLETIKADWLYCKLQELKEISNN